MDLIPGTDWRGAEIPVDDHLAVIRAGFDHLFLLNTTASIVWQSWRNGNDLNGMAHTLASAFDVEKAQALSDVRELVRLWRASSLIGPGPDSETTARQRRPADIITSGFVSEQTYRLGQFEFTISYREENLEHLMHPVLAHCAWDGSKSPASTMVAAKTSDGLTLLIGERELCRETELHVFVLAALREINILAARAVEPELVIHGAAFGREGRCVVMPGSGGRGKSTLVAAMALEGYDYLGDEIVTIESDTHRLLPIPTSLNLKPASIPVLTNLYGDVGPVHELNTGTYHVSFMSPDRFGNDLARSYEVAAFVFPRYEAGARPALQTCGSLELIGGLVDSVTAFLPGGSIDRADALFAWLRSIKACKLSFDNLHDGVSLVKEFLV